MNQEFIMRTLHQSLLWFTAVIIFTMGTVYKANGQDFKKWKQDYLQKFKEYQNKYDKQFHNMLQKHWEDLEVKTSPDPYRKDKPDKLPSVKSPSDDKSSDVPRISLNNKNKGEAPEPRKKGQNKMRTNIKANVPAKSTKKGLTPAFNPSVKNAQITTSTLTYFDVPIRYKYYNAFHITVSRPISKEGISKFWKHLSTKDYPSFLEQVKEIKSNLQLNDFGYGQLLKNIGNQIYGEDTPESTMFTWFMLTQSDFNTRLGYNNRDVYLLTHTNPRLFNTTYFTLKDTKYYAVSFNSIEQDLPSKVYTYKGDYPKSKLAPLKLTSQSFPSFPAKLTSRTMNFSYNDTSYTFEVPINKQVINYYRNYPNAYLGLYFNSKMDSKTYNVLSESLQPLIKGKPDVEKVNIILRFVQTSLKYKTDQQQFNREKYMFPEEALYYPAADCEDRAALFAYLVQNMVGLDYITLRYPTHLTIAVNFPENPPASGTSFNYHDKTYYMADPTYINASVGRKMPSLEGESPKIIDTKL